MAIEQKTVPENFRVIIVGGGPVGLTTALALSKAGIDFVLLERRDNVLNPSIGAGVALWPHGIRFMSQLGLHDRLAPLGVAQRQITTQTLQGHMYGVHKTFAITEKKHGACLTMFHRAHIIEAIHSGFSAKEVRSQILTNKKLKSIDTTDTGVVVTCHDGSVYKGSIVIGADGVHSKTRQLMRSMALEHKSREVNPEKPFSVEYRLLWGTVPRTPALNLDKNNFYETHGKDASMQAISSNDFTYLFVYERIPPGGAKTKAVPYTDEEADAMAARWQHMAVGDITLGELYAQRSVAGLVDLDEGVVPHWSWGGRVVLVGDSCHKVTPNRGIGFNIGLGDVAVLVSEIHGVIANSMGGSPSSDDLQEAFVRYQAKRAKSVKTIAGICWDAIRQMSWKTTMDWLMDRYILAWIPGYDNILAYYLANLLRKEPVLDCVESEEYYTGTLPWANAFPVPRSGNLKGSLSDSE
ncbi:FAD binding domain-containing protein [Bombardia bombarda]|uniref:FAD binding domain-containing protein n=1 Tax=Bombardia bombarda TaxID=252184 RepID=A0AA39WGR8_9PEZI|nr:FAD binding domain-containing protein [Bombardia bombarda]